MTSELEQVLAFWFDEHEPQAWFVKDDAFDAALATRFGALNRGFLDNPDSARGLATDPRTTLAVLIVLDQFSRNLHRGDARSFAGDPLAREIARRAIARGYHLDSALPPGGALFFYMPFEHSESLADQDWSCALIETLGSEQYSDYAIRHRDVIVRFGRFPHRNAVLGRQNTPEEEVFLSQPGSSF